MILQTNLTAEEIYAAAAAAGARPDPLLTISQWADRYRWLSQRASAEHGRWRTERTPYLREIMDCLSPSSLIERVAFMKGAQIGGTECGNNWMGYVIHQAPGPMMPVQPTVEMAKRNSKQRIEPLIIFISSMSRRCCGSWSAIRSRATPATRFCRRISRAACWC